MNLLVCNTHNPITRLVSRIFYHIARFKYFCVYGILMRMPWFRSGGALNSEKYWDKRAEMYDLQYGKKQSYTQTFKKIIENTPEPLSHVVELGCGTASNLSELALCYPGIVFTGIDYSEQMLRAAQKNAN